MDKLLLIVEDEEQIRKVLYEHLTSEGFRVNTAVNGNEAIQMWEKNNPDLILLDIMLPAMSGIDVLKKVRAVSDTPIIMLTAKADEIDKLLGLEMGADDYVTKPFSPREVAARIKAVLRRSESVNDRRFIVYGSLKIDVYKYEAYVNGKLLSLTGTEFRILLMLAESPGQVFSRLQILERIYGDIYEGYERTVDTHINNLRRKMEKQECLDLKIKTVYGIGYKLSREGN